MNNAAKIPHRIKCTSLPSDAKTYTKLAEFAKKHHYSPTQLRRLITKRRVKAFYYKGCWYVKSYS